MVHKSVEKRGPDSPGPAGSVLRLRRGCGEADGRTDSGYRQKPICWQRRKPSAQLPSPPSQQQLKGWDPHGCPSEPVRLLLSRPGPGGRGWPPQASAATYGSGGATSSWLLQDFPVLKPGSLLPRSQAECLGAHDPERAFKVQTILGPHSLEIHR